MDRKDPGNLLSSLQNSRTLPISEDSPEGSVVLISRVKSREVKTTQ